MRADSKELAYRINILTAFQSGEEIQYRHKIGGFKQWLISSNKNLAFNFETMEYRKKPQLREGYVFESMLHNHPESHIHTKKEGTCFKVREVE